MDRRVRVALVAVGATLVGAWAVAAGIVIRARPILGPIASQGSAPDLGERVPGAG